MRFVALALILLMLPIFVTVLRSFPKHRDRALMALCAMLFVSGELQIDAAIVTWPLWNGAVRGILISPVDMLALAMIITRRDGMKKLPFVWLFGLYLVPLLISIILASLPMAASFTSIQFLRGFLLFVAVGGELYRPTAMRALLCGLSLGLMLQAGYVIYQKLSGVVQAAGTMGHQNLLGIMAELSLIPLVAALLEGERHILLKLGTLAGMIIIAGGGSRGAMGIAAVAIVLLALLALIRNRSPQKLKMVGIGVVVMMVVTPLGFATLKDRFGETSLTAEEEQRTRMESAAKAMAADHWFGVGANFYAHVSNTQGYAADAGVDWNQSNRTVPVHNAFLLARAETGFAGEIALYLLLLVPAVVGCRHAFRHRRTPEGAVALGSALALVAVTVHSTYEFSIHVYQAQMLVIINLAIIAGVVRRQALAKSRSRPMSRSQSQSRDQATGNVFARAGTSASRQSQSPDKDGRSPQS